MQSFLVVSLLLVASLAYGEGLVVHRSKDGVTFSEAASISVNDKDKALGLGSQPNVAGPINKLPQVRLNGMLVKDTALGVVAIYAAGQAPQYLLPQGLPKNTQPKAADAWKTAKMTFRKSQSDKTTFDVPADEFLAFIPEGVPGLAALSMDTQALGLMGGKQGFIPAQIELVSAAVKAYNTNPAMAPVELYVRRALRSNLERFDAGVESRKSLDEGLQFAKLSEQAYPSQPEHQQLRTLLAQRKVWLDRRIAILRALHAAEDPDTFLLAYRDFEKHQASFTDIRQQKRDALEQSMKAHWTQGKERTNAREYRSAYRELRLASSRQPSNPALQKDLSVVWSEYSREVAGSRRARRIPLTPGQQDAITQAIHFASRYKEQNKLDEALKSLTEAEAIDRESLPLLLKEAEILSARNEFGRALATLDRYDQLAVDEERAPGAKLRNELAFQITNVLREERSKIEAAWGRQQFNLTHRLALDALRTDDRDPDILYFAGLSSLVTRDAKHGREYLAKFLDASNTLDADDNRRISALRLLTAAEEPKGAEPQAGEPNWFSGKRLPAGVSYCPLSLAFGPRVERIEASNKLSVHYEWDGPRLKGITPSFDKPQNATGEKPLVFTYESSMPQVISVQPERGLAISSNDRDELLKASSVVLLNSPLVEPLAVERVTGKKITVTVAGNRFFNPFVWQRLHYFQLTYDDLGRVKLAREISGQDSASEGAVDVEFDWDGLKLSAVRGYQRTGEDRHVQVYERKQQYQDNRLIGEEIRANGKLSRIKYVYDGATLVSAHCEKDETTDNRSRDVFFASSASRTLRR